MKTGKRLVISVAVGLATVLLWPMAAWAVPGWAAPAGQEAAQQYKLAYQTAQADGNGALFTISSLTVVDDNRLELVAYYSDGGCISKELLTVNSVVPAGDGVTVINLLLTLDGNACKAALTRQLTATIELPSPGTYRVKLWLKELYRGKSEYLYGQQDITVPGK